MKFCEAIARIEADSELAIVLPNEKIAASLYVFYAFRPGKLFHLHVTSDKVNAISGCSSSWAKPIQDFFSSDKFRLVRIMDDERKWEWVE